MSTNFEIISRVIRERRSLKPAKMNGKIIPDDMILELLKLADWAPTHGVTEPWRFFVFGGDALQKFTKIHADMYRAYTAPERFKQSKYDKYAGYGKTASHLIVVAMKRTLNSKIPDFEELSAVSASVQNILLGAEALGIAAMWNTGGMAHSPEMRAYLGLAPEDMIVSFLYLGYTDHQKLQGHRLKPLAEKIIWKGKQN